MLFSQARKQGLGCELEQPGLKLQVALPIKSQHQLLLSFLIISFWYKLHKNKINPLMFYHTNKVWNDMSYNVINLFNHIIIWEVERQIKDRFYLLVHLLPACNGQERPEWNRSWELKLWLPCGWKETFHRCHHLVPPRVCIGIWLESGGRTRNWTQTLWYGMQTSHPLS